MVGPARLFAPLQGELLKRNLIPAQDVQRLRIGRVAQELDRIDRIEPRGSARMSGDEDQLLFPHRARAPAIIRLRAKWLIILINSKESDVQHVAREFKVVRVAAESGDSDFRQEDQPHVGIAAITIEVVPGAVPERDDFALQTRFLGFFRFQSIPHRPPRQRRLGRDHLRFDGRLHLLGTILNRIENVQLQVRAGPFFR